MPIETKAQKDKYWRPVPGSECLITDLGGDAKLAQQLARWGAARLTSAGGTPRAAGEYGGSCRRTGGTADPAHGRVDGVGLPLSGFAPFAGGALGFRPLSDNPLGWRSHPQGTHAKPPIVMTRPP